MLSHRFGHIRGSPSLIGNTVVAGHMDPRQSDVSYNHRAQQLGHANKIASGA